MIVLFVLWWKKFLQFGSASHSDGDTLNVKNAVKGAKSQFLSHFVTVTGHRFFLTPSSIPVNLIELSSSISLCENFVKFFTDKVCSLSFPPTSLLTDPAVPPLSPAVFQLFQLITFTTLSNIVKHLRPTNFLLNSISPCLFKMFLTLLDQAF